VSEDDWRRMGQEASLTQGTRFVLETYAPPRPDWDHDHCSMCNAKFVAPAMAAAMSGEDIRTVGYTTTPDFVRGPRYEWVCTECFADFAAEFQWVGLP
jgi:hypothetical protein